MNYDAYQMLLLLHDPILKVAFKTSHQFPRGHLRRTDNNPIGGVQIFMLEG